MSDLVELSHALTNAWTRAALCRDMGEYAAAERLERQAAEMQAEIERLDMQSIHREFATTADAQAAAVRERGVS